MFGFLGKVSRDIKRQAQGRIPFVTKLCPFCFDYFKMSETPFRCMTESARCPPQPDPILQQIWNDPLPKGKVIYSNGYALSGTCKTCKRNSNQRLCPHCHMELPHTFEDHPSCTIAVIGAKSAGKSHFLPILVETLKQSIGRDLGFNISALDDRTNIRYGAEFRDPLYTCHEVLEETRSGLSEEQTRLPLVFKFLSHKDKKDGNREITGLTVLSFFDAAGEDMNSQNTMAVVNKYIYRSDGIILLLDPLQLTAVRDRLSGGVTMPPRQTDTSDIVTRLINLIHTATDAPADKLIDIPIAVVLSKFDAVAPLVTPQLIVNSPSFHGKGFDTKDFETVNTEVQSLLVDWDASYLVEQVRSGFLRHGFFAISALGAVPHGRTVTAIRPHRIADPFLWLLHTNKIIKSAT